MNKILYITANPKAVEASYSLQLGEHFLQAAKEAKPSIEIERIDLFDGTMPMIDYTVMSAWGKLASNEALNEEEQAVIGRMNELSDQFVSADGYIFVSPMWNLTFPPHLSAYLNNVMVARKTFRYTGNGPEGLLKGRKAVHIQARGGFYSEEAAQGRNFGDNYLKTALAIYTGITDYASIYVEGMNAFPDKAGEFLAEAKKRAEAAAKSFVLDAVQVG